MLSRYLLSGDSRDYAPDELGYTRENKYNAAYGQRYLYGVDWEISSALHGEFTYLYRIPGILRTKP